MLFALILPNFALLSHIICIYLCQPTSYSCHPVYDIQFNLSHNSLHGLRHEEEKMYELEMAWISDDTHRVFQHVPAELQAEAEAAAKQFLEEQENDED